MTTRSRFAQSLKNQLLKQSMRIKLMWNVLQMNLTTSIINKPLRMLIVNVIIITVIRVLFLKEIHAEGFPCIGVNVSKVIHPMEQKKAGLVQWVDGEWYDPNAVIEEQRITSEYVDHTLNKLKQSLEKVPSDAWFGISLDFVKYHIPTKLWSKNAAESSWNQQLEFYLNEMNSHLKTKEDDLVYLNFKTAAYTYNACHLDNNMSNKETMALVNDFYIHRYYKK